MIDGDTIVLAKSTTGLPKVKVRLVAIDAPELSQPYGPESADALNKFKGKFVTVEFKKKGPYGRIIGQVFLDKIDIGLLQVSEGNAWYAAKYRSHLPNTEHQKKYYEAEQKAQQLKRGLWADDDVMSPWDWRDHTSFSDFLYGSDSP